MFDERIDGQMGIRIELEKNWITGIPTEQNKKSSYSFSCQFTLCKLHDPNFESGLSEPRNSREITFKNETIRYDEVGLRKWRKSSLFLVFHRNRIHGIWILKKILNFRKMSRNLHQFLHFLDLHVESKLYWLALLVLFFPRCFIRVAYDFKRSTDSTRIHTNCQLLRMFFCE